MKLLMTYNPRAGSGRAEKLLPQVSELLQQNNLDVDVVVTEYPHHAAEIVEKHDLSGFDAIIAAGGDGTLFDVVNGIFSRPDELRLPVGVLPVGTGNAFVRDFPLEEGDWKTAISVIAANKRKHVDVGKFEANDKTNYFMNILGLGFVSDVIETAQRLKWMGNVAYTVGVLHQTLFLNPHKVTLDLDGIVIERDNIFVEVSNTRYTSNFLMAPNARFDDGKFDVTLLGALNRRRLLKALPTVFTGEHIHLDEVETFQVRKLNISANVPKIISPDGELWCETPVQITCLHKALEVFVP